jgi:hypothetical protein
MRQRHKLAEQKPHSPEMQRGQPSLDLVHIYVHLRMPVASSLQTPVLPQESDKTFLKQQ